MVNFLTNTGDGLPEPPAFLRDIVYPPDGGRDPRYDSDSAMPYHPPSPGRQSRVRININFIELLVSLASVIFGLSRSGSSHQKALCDLPVSYVGTFILSVEEKPLN